MKTRAAARGPRCAVGLGGGVGRAARAAATRAPHTSLSLPLSLCRCVNHGENGMNHGSMTSQISSCDDHTV